MSEAAPQSTAQPRAPQLKGAAPESAREKDKKAAVNRAFRRRQSGRQGAVARYQSKMESRKKQQLDRLEEGGERPGGPTVDEAVDPGLQQMAEQMQAATRSELDMSDVIGEDGREGEKMRQREPTGLASLDFTLPAHDPDRWVRRHFTTPRGEVAVHARSITDDRIRMLKRAGVAFATVCILALLYGVVVRRMLRVSGRRTAEAVAILGVLGLLFGALPVYAVVLLAAGLAARLVLAVRSPA